MDRSFSIKILSRLKTVHFIYFISVLLIEIQVPNIRLFDLFLFYFFQFYQQLQSLTSSFVYYTETMLENSCSHTYYLKFYMKVYIKVLKKVVWATRSRIRARWLLTMLCIFRSCYSNNMSGSREHARAFRRTRSKKKATLQNIKYDFTVLSITRCVPRFIYIII